MQCILHLAKVSVGHSGSLRQLSTETRGRGRGLPASASAAAAAQALGNAQHGRQTLGVSGPRSSTGPPASGGASQAALAAAAVPNATQGVQLNRVDESGKPLKSSLVVVCLTFSSPSDTIEVRGCRRTALFFCASALCL